MAATFISDNEVSAVMEGQPRHQHRPLTTASHHTIARRPPTPLEAHRAHTQRQLKAFLPQSHPTKEFSTDELPIDSIKSQRHHYHPQQPTREHLKRRRSGGSRHRKQTHDVKIQHIVREGAEMSQDRKRGCYPPFEYFTTHQEMEDAPAAQNTQQRCNQFKGCLQHTSKGGS